MKFDFSTTIAGVSLKDIRKVFRKTEYVNTEFLSEHLEISKDIAEKLLTQLVNQDFVEQDEHDANWFKTTSLGKSLAASAPQRIKNKKARELYAAFLKRVEHVNSDESEFAYGIDRVVLLGSFLNPDLPDYGDIDFIVRLLPRYPRGSDKQKELEEASRAVGIYPNSFVDRLIWPSRQVLKYLKNGSRYVSIDEDEGSLEMIEPKGAYRIIYECKKFPLKP